MQLLLTARFGALLFDNWMPKINGTELCRMIRFHDQKHPIFFCPGAVTEGDKRPRLTPVRKPILEGLFTRTRSPLSYAPP
jgi:DNA-binding response OmpR family regulator